MIGPVAGSDLIIRGPSAPHMMSLISGIRNLVDYRCEPAMVRREADPII
jgi:hypothetical protein